jgi:hypothetical protein
MTAKTQFCAHRYCVAPMMDRDDNIMKSNKLEAAMCAICAVRNDVFREAA